MTVQDPKRHIRLGVFRGKQLLEERVVKKRANIYIGQNCKENDETQFIILSSAIPKMWELFTYKSSTDTFEVHLKKSMTGRIAIEKGVTILLGEQLKPGKFVRISGDDVYITLKKDSRGRIIIGKVNILFNFVVTRDESALARVLYQRTGAPGRIPKVIGLSLLGSFLLHIVPLLYICLQDWPRDDEILVIQMYREAKIEDMQIEKEEEPEEEEPVIVEESENVLPGIDDSKNAEPAPEPGTITRGELMDQITDKHREQGAMITAQILGVEGGVEGFYADMLGSNTHIADMSDIAAGDIGVGASGNLLNQLAAGEGGSGGGLMGLDNGKGGVGTGPKVVVDNKKTTTKRAKVEFKMSDKSDYIGAPPPGSKEAIESMFRKKKGDIKSCYQRVINAQGKASGRFVIAITVTKDGQVHSVNKIEDQIGGEMFQCVRQRIMNWKFGTLKAPIAFKKTWVFS